MEDSASPFEIDPPSSGKLLKSVLITALIAAVLLVTVILPAEYGIDPTGIGQRLGLTDLSGDVAVAEAPAPAAAPQPAVAASAPSGTSFYIEEMIVSDEILPEGFPKPGELPNPAVQQTHSSAAKADSISIELDAGGMIEYKAQMERGQVLLYSWQTERGGIHYDFHAEPWDGPDGYWIRYKVGDDVAADHGSIVTPLDGQHGWYFHNTNDYPVSIQLELSGYYDEVVEYAF